MQLNVYVVSVAFLINTLGSIPAHADEFILPKPGTMVRLSPAFNPPILKGIKVHPEDPFRFDFILDKGDSLLASDQLKQECNKLIKYFLASLTIPEKDLWVNLSPYEKDRIVPESFGRTEMGRDLLALDYILKQITASLIYPEDEIGKKFWKRVYEETAKKFGTTNIPVNTINKVWIVPHKAVVYENAKAGTAYVVESSLKLMLEEDYLAMERNERGKRGLGGVNNNAHSVASKIVREIVIPQLTIEINQGKNFAPLRQVYNSLILAVWYKKKLKGSILNQVYSDKNKVSGVDDHDPQEKQKIYEHYLQAFKAGAYNYIKEEMDPVTQVKIPRKYFSGGMELSDKAMRVAMSVVHLFDKSQMSKEPIQATVVVTPSALSVEALLTTYEGLPGSAAIYEFAGVGGDNVYNGGIFHLEDDQVKTIIVGRVEGEFTEFSRVMFFQQEDDGKWYPIKDAPVFENAQDPSVKKIDNQLVLSMVRVKDSGEVLENGSPRLVYYTDFFQFETLQDLDPEVRIARGPLWMKDIRLLELNDKRVLIMTRPQGKIGGLGKIGYLIVENYRKFVELGEKGKEESTLARWLMEKAIILEGMFRPDQWGGANELFLLKNGMVGVLGHIARRNEEGNREYYPITFEFNHETGKFYHLRIIGRLEDLVKLLNQEIPIKEPDPSKPLDLANVWFGTGLVFIRTALGNVRYILFGGVRDTRTVVAEIRPPFSSPIAEEVDPAHWLQVEATLARANPNPNHAMRANQQDKTPTTFSKGGIDLTPADVNVNTKIASGDNGQRGIQFHLDPAMLKQLQSAPGFVPVIIKMETLTDARLVQFLLEF